MQEEFHDVKSLQIACIQWLKRECARVAYFVENCPAGTYLTRRIFAKPCPWDSQQAAELFDGAIRAVECDDLRKAISDLSAAQRLLAKDFRSLHVYGSENYNGYHEDVIDLLARAYRGKQVRTEFIELWFAMTHNWRSKGAKGVPSIPDLSQFMVIETIATVFLLVIGVVLPTIQSSGLYKIVPVLYFAIMCVAQALQGFLRNSNVRALLLWVCGGIGLIPAHYLIAHSSKWLLWSWVGGTIVGVLIGNHIAYTNARKRSNKYGPLACLWTRHIKKNTYEYLMLKADGEPVWHYQATGWFKNADLLLGNNLSMDYRAALHNGCYESMPDGGWIQCFPALVSTRMVGMRRRNPVDWEEALRSTPGITQEAIDKFFHNTPSPLGPPASALGLPLVILPGRKPIPW